MELTIKCPDCGRTLKVTVEHDVTPEIQIIHKHSRTDTWTSLAMNKDELHLGDVIECRLTNGDALRLEVAALNPYGKDQLALVMKDCYGEDKQMYKDVVKGVNWRDSLLRKYANTDIYSLLSDDLKAIIKPRTIKQKIGGQIIETTDLLWALSYTEMYGGDYEVDVDDVHFPLYENEGSRVKMNADGETWCYWLRSAGNTNNFRYVYSDGSSSSSAAVATYGVALGFLI